MTFAGVIVRIRGGFRRLGQFAPGNITRCSLYRIGAVKIGKGVIIAKGVALGFGVNIGDNTKIERGVVIGDGTKVNTNVEICQRALIGPGSTVGNNAIIGRNTFLFNCIIGDHSIVEYGVIFTGSNKNWISIGKYCYIGIHVVLDNTGGIEIGDHVHIAGPSVGIWTHTSVYQCLSGDKPEDTTRKIIRPED